MKSHEDRRPFYPARTLSLLIVVACHLLVLRQAHCSRSKPSRLATRQPGRSISMRWPSGRSRIRRAAFLRNLPVLQHLRGRSPAAMPAAPSTTSPASGSPNPGTQAVELFEDDFDQTGAISFVQHRVVLLVFAPQTETDSWRPDSELQPWSRRAVICPVHEGSLGDRAQRLAKAFGIDPVQGRHAHGAGACSRRRETGAR